MKYNERLMTEALKSSGDALSELKFNAGSGDCEAQYYLAIYYAKICGHLHDSNYHFWLEKSKENGYVPGIGKPIHPEYFEGIYNENNIKEIIDALNVSSNFASLLCFL